MNIILDFPNELVTELYEKISIGNYNTTYNFHLYLMSRVESFYYKWYRFVLAFVITNFLLSKQSKKCHSDTRKLHLEEVWENK